MGIRVVHLVDEKTPEDALRQLRLLSHTWQGGEVQQAVLVLGRRPPLLAVPTNVPCRQVHAGWGRSGRVQGLLAQWYPQVILAWSGAGAAAVGNAWPGRCPVAAVVVDPLDAADAGYWWPAFPHVRGLVDVICTSQVVQDKLTAAGVPAASTVVLRPGVDVAELDAVRLRSRRSDFGLPETGRVFLTASPPTRQGGQFYAVWAMAILHQIRPQDRLVIPGTSREQYRLRRLIDTIYCPQVYHVLEDRHTPADLLAVADALLFTPVADVSSYWVIQAMAAGVPVVGTSVPCVEELIVDGANGFLCPPAQPHSLATRIRQAMESAALDDRVAAARQWVRDHLNARLWARAYLSLLGHLVSGEPTVPDTSAKPRPAPSAAR